MSNKIILFEFLNTKSNNKYNFNIVSHVGLNHGNNNEVDITRNRTVGIIFFSYRTCRNQPLYGSSVKEKTHLLISFS